MAKTKWTIERWMRDIVAVGTSADDQRDARGLRELVITSCAELDLALAELLSKRLSGSEDEINDFLGADEDGRAPAGSFGARIQLAHMVGLITAMEMEILRLLKRLRNDFAHKYHCDWDTPRVLQTTLSLFGCVIKVGIERGTINGTIRPARAGDSGITSTPAASTDASTATRPMSPSTPAASETSRR